MKIGIIVVVATAAMCGEAVRFVFGAIPAESFHFLLLLIVAAGCAIAVALGKAATPIAETAPQHEIANRAKAAAPGR